LLIRIFFALIAFSSRHIVDLDTSGNSGSLSGCFLLYLILQSGIFVPSLAVYSFLCAFSSLVGLKKRQTIAANLYLFRVV